MKYTSIVDEDVIDIIDGCNSELLLDKLANKTFLITGASGMIGSYFVFTLAKLNEKYDANIKIKAVVRNVEKAKEMFGNMNVDIIKHDVTEPFNIKEKVDYIVHSASPASPKIMANYPVETNLANTLGTANTLKLALDKKTCGYLFVSSREIYGEPLDEQMQFTENGVLGQVNPLVPRNGYAEGKKAAENLCCAYKEEYGINTKIVRLAHTYGPGMSINDGRVQADFLKNVINAEDIVLKSDGSSVRTYTYVSDAVKAMFLILLNSSDIVYNVADEKNETTIRKLAETLVSISDNNIKLVFDLPKKSEKGVASFKNGILSTKKIREELKWKPKYDIKTGFSRTIKHLKEELNK